MNYPTMAETPKAPFVWMMSTNAADSLLGKKQTFRNVEFWSFKKKVHIQIFNEKIINRLKSNRC